MKNKNLVYTAIIFLIYITILFVPVICSQSDGGMRGVDIGYKFGWILIVIAGLIYLIILYFKGSPDKKQPIDGNTSNSILPETIKCPNCGEDLELDEKERKEKKFTCAVCKNVIDIRNAASNVTQRHMTEEEYECSECLAEVREEDKICPKCGANLEDNEEDEEVEIYTCSDCEAEVSIDDIVCPNCGAQIDEIEED